MYRFAVDRPIAVLMITAAATFFGLLAYRELGLELLPDLAHPTLTLRTAWPAAAPEEVEQEVTRRLETVVGTVEALKGMTSASRAGESELILEFDWDSDMDRAAQRVRERLSRIELPPGAEAPMLLRYDPSLEPVLSLAVSGEGTPTELRFYAEEVLGPEIARIDGVAAVRVLGGLEREIQVRLRPSAVAGRGLSVQQVAERLAAANVNVAGGTLREGAVEFLVRTVAELKDPEALRQVVVAEQEGVLIRLGDVADVVATVQEPRSVVRVDGKAAVRLDVDRQAGANLVEVCDRVRQAVFGDEEQQNYTRNLPPGSPPPRSVAATRKDGKPAPDQAVARHHELTAFLAWRRPAGVDIAVVADQSVFIRASLDEVRSAAWVGGLLAVLVLYLFLRSAWSTLIVAIVIPLSLLLTFVPLLLCGVTLNVMSLGGLALGIGMLVDNSIVMLESIFRCREEGDGIRESAIRGTREVGGAMVASTLSSVAVFLPVVFVEGVAGQVFSDLALAVVFSQITSLGVAMLLVPMMASRGVVKRFEADRPKSWFLPWRAFPAWRARSGFVKVITLPWALFQTALEALGNTVVLLAAAILLPLVMLARGLFRVLGVISWVPFQITEVTINALKRAQTAALRLALRAPLVLIVGLAGLGWFTFDVASNLGAELIPDVHQGVVTAELRFPVGTPLEQTAMRSGTFADGLGRLPGVTRVDSFVGQPDVGQDDGRERGTHTAAVSVRLDSSAAQAEAALSVALRKALTLVPGAEMELTRPALFSLRPPIRVEILGHALPALGEAAQAVEQTLEAVPGIRDVRSSIRPGHPELQLEYDRARLAALGMRPREVAERLRGQLEGEVATWLRQQAERVDVRVRLDPDRVRSRGDLEQLVVNPGAPVPLPLEAVAHITAAEGPAAIHHVDGQRAALVTARTVGFDLGTTADAVRAALDSLPPQTGQELRLRGQDEEMRTSMDSLRFALILAIFLVYMVMASQFESLRAPLVIMATLPLAGSGAFLILGAVDEPLSVVVLVGLITLAGIVVNNAIVLVDYTRQLQERGLGVVEAMEEAGRARLRPVLMTTLTSVFGLLPLALGSGEGVELQKPMALTLIGGLCLATVLTLVVIPVLYRVVVGDSVRKLG